MNNGSCEDIPSRGNQPPTFRCTCPSNFTGERCEILVGKWYSTQIVFQYNYHPMCVKTNSRMSENVVTAIIYEGVILHLITRHYKLSLFVKN